MKYFVVEEWRGNNAQGLCEEPFLKIVRGLSADMVTSVLDKADARFDCENDTGSAYSPYRYHKIVSEHGTMAEAEEELKKRGRRCVR